MDQNHAGQIAALLNTRNQLVKNYDAKAILAARARFLFEVRDDQVVGCVEVKKSSGIRRRSITSRSTRIIAGGGSRKRFSMLLPRVPSKTEPASCSVSGATMLRVRACF